MATTNELPALDVNSYDYIVVGGGTAARTLVIEGGPSDFMDDRVLNLKEWLSLLGGELDYDYGTTEQPMGNSNIRHSRAKVLGGCSSHNTLISFRPFEYDCRQWVSKGCKGWDFETFTRIIDNLRNTIQPVHARHRNQLCKDWIQACSSAMNIPVIENFNDDIRKTGELTEGVGFFNISYNPDDGRRSSASVAYIHPILRGDEKRPNLTILTNAWVSKVNIEGDTVTGVDVTLQSGVKHTLRAKKETVLCAGAVDTPRLMMLSGLGPREQLSALGIPVSIIMWELNSPVDHNMTTMDSDAGIFLRRELPDAAGFDGKIADVMMHCYQIPFTLNTTRLGYDEPVNAFCMTPNIPRPAPAPSLDFRYFTDPEGYDAATIVAGLKAAREIAKQSPFKEWIKREVAPGPKLQTDEELSEYGRRVAHTVYHPAGTTKMGNVATDPMAVVDPTLKVRGLKGIRIADAGVFPDMPSINPMLTVLTIGERAAELIAGEAGWSRNQPRL
ncbi:Glucose-methanol-choline oxidoreductase C-terminal [Penicillium expansum]|nr:Glucose-methanol-choline oxidoreductase C-terminal [Penicillium expansum]